MVPFLGSHADYGNSTFWDTTTNIPNQPWPSCWQPNIVTPPGCQAGGGGSVPGCPTTANEVRHKFSLNTCDDCHSGETKTNFTHVSPFTAPAQLSLFLTGFPSCSATLPCPGGSGEVCGNNTLCGIPDPGGQAHVVRSFNDLQRRAQVLQSLASHPCFIFPLTFAAQQLVLTTVH
jgi:hypothetical protein